MRWEWFVAALLALLVMTNAVMTWLLWPAGCPTGEPKYHLDDFPKVPPVIRQNGYGHEPRINTFSVPSSTVLSSRVQSSSSPSSDPVSSPSSPLPSSSPETPVLNPLVSEYIDVYSKKYRMRLGCLLSMSGRNEICLEFRDESMRVRDRLSSLELQHLGWTWASVGPGMVEISRAGRTMVATAWPLDVATVSNRQEQVIRDRPIAPSSSLSAHSH